MVPASLARRFACLFYDALLVVAVLFASAFLPLLAGLVLSGTQPDLGKGAFKWAMDFYWVVAAGFYLTWFWGAGGQTLAMKTWRIRLVDAAGGPISRAQAWKRYFLALVSLGFCYLWAFADRDRQFLHDRLAGTRLVRVD